MLNRTDFTDMMITVNKKYGGQERVMARVVGHIGLNEGDGIFAVYQVNDLMCVAFGDDGVWREHWRCHTSWWPCIEKAVVGAVYDEPGPATEPKEIDW